MLGTVEDLSRYPVPHHPLEEVLGLLGSEPQGSGKGARELDQVVIEQRNPRLQRVRHARPIDLGEDVSGEVGAEVEGLEPRQRIQPGAIPRIERGRAVGHDREIEQAPKGPRREQGNGVEVSLHPRQGETVEEVLPGGPLGQAGAQGAQPPAEPQVAETPKVPAAIVHHVAVVAGKQLVAPVARQDDLYVLSGQARHQVRRDRRRIGERFVDGPQKVVQQPEVLWTDEQLVVLRRVPLGDLACVGQFVVALLPESHGERLDRRAELGRHDRHHGGRIDPPAQEGADGDVADEVRANRVAQEGPEPLRRVLLAGRDPGVAEAGRHLPVAARNAGAAVLDGQRVPGGELGHAFDDAERIRHVPVLEVRRQGTPIHVAAGPGVLHDRLQLGREHKSFGCLGIVERLDPQAVTRQEQRASRMVPNGKGEHSPQSFDARLAVLLVQVHEHFRVRRRREPVPLRQELGGQLPVVVDLAVEDHPDGSVLVGQRLVPGLEVDDTETPHPDAEGAVRVEAAAVGPAVREHLPHPAKRLQIGGPGGIDVEGAEDTAHRESVPLSARRGHRRPARRHGSSARAGHSA